MHDVENGATIRVVFDIDELLIALQAARHDTEPRLAVKEALSRALARPEAAAEALAPTEAGITMLHHGDDFTVLHVVWAPKMSIYPHDHRMWAAIGIYAGQEDNTFFRRSAPKAKTLRQSGGKQLAAGDVALLGDDTIHGVFNPSDRLTGAIHVYGGDFVNQPRSQWGPGPVEERPYDIADARRQFAQGNDAWRATR